MASPNPLLPLYDPIRWDFLERAHDIYDELRRTEPVHWAAHRNEWVVTTFAETKTILRDPRFLPFAYPQAVNSAAAQAGLRIPTAVAILEAATFFDSSPGHLTARRYLNRALNDRPLSELAPVIRKQTAEQLAQLRAAGGGDLVTLLARAIPYRVMAELLGVPTADLPFLDENLTGVLPLIFHHTARVEQYAEANARGTACLNYVEELVRERRVRPRSDGISRMLLEDAGGTEDRSIAARVIFLFLVGIETTVLLLGESMRRLIAHPDVAERWRSGQAGTETAIEELLRYISPVHLVPRVASTELPLLDRTISRGQLVIAVLAAANRDPLRFADPHRLDLSRPGPPHTAFGDGAHHCLGAALARLESSIVLPLFLGLPPLRLTGRARHIRLDFLTVLMAQPFEIV